MANVLVNENSLSAIAAAIREKAGTQDAYCPGDMAQAILDIPSGSSEEPERKDVNFYDYDGKRLYSYTLAEVQAMTALPAAPAPPEGLVSDGWNWTLTELKSWGEKANVGHKVYAPDGRIILKVSIKDKPKTLYVTYTDGHSSTVDWGDGTSNQYDATDVSASHEFAVGDYTIVITAQNLTSALNVCRYGTTFYIPCDALIEAFFPKTVTTAHLYMCPSIKKTSVAVGDWDNYCPSLMGFVTPNGETKKIAITGLGCKDPCFALGTTVYDTKEVRAETMYAMRVYNGNTSDDTSSFRDVAIDGDIYAKTFANNNRAISRVVIKNCTTIGDYFLNGAYSVEYVEIPAETTEIGGSFIYAASSAQYYAPIVVRFRGSVPPTVTGSKFLGVRPKKILVPAGSLSAYRAATNLSQYASYMEEY